MAQPRPEIDKYGRFIDSGGLIVPETYTRNPSSAIVTHMDRVVSSKGFAQGLVLSRDESTLAVKFPRKGSGYDDLISQAIVDGRVANVGVSPVVAPQISAMVRRQQNQALSATIDVTGRPTPADKARDAIAMFNASPLGVSAALETMVYRLCTYNRGTPIATVPITFDFESWEEHGMIAHPILASRQKEENATRFWLEVDWQRFGTPVPFLPHPFDLEATGNEEYPYWYRATRTNGSRVWVLLHSSQIVPVLPGKSAQPGIGISSVWMCLGYLAENILIADERNEKMLYSLTDGVYIIGGVPDANPDEIKKQMEEGRIERYERGYRVAKGSDIIVSPLENVSVAQITLRQPPGIEFKDWREYSEDVIAFCFGESLSALVVRGGVGYGAQADAAIDNAAEAGIGAHLARIGSALGSIYPRVMISVTRINDRVARANIKAFTQFAAGARSMIEAGVLSADQVAKIIDRDILTLPEADEVTTSANAEDNEDDLEEDLRESQSAADDETKPAPTSSAERQAQSVVQNLDNHAQWLADYERMTVPEKVRAFREKFASEIYYRDGDVTITDEDEARAYEQARRRVGQDVFELLTAEKVES